MSFEIDQFGTIYLASTGQYPYHGFFQTTHSEQTLTSLRISTIRFLLAISCGLAFTGCGSNSQISRSYVDPVLKKLDLQGVLVVAVTKTQSSRIDFEDAFVKELRRKGVVATASHTLVPKLDKDSEKVLAAATAANLEMILLTRYMGASSDDVFHPGTIYYGVTPAYGAGYHRGMGGYYGRAYEVAYEQPVWTTNTTHTLVSDLYITESKKHVWQAVSETIQASDIKKLRNDAIGSLMGNLKDQGLLN